jgi:ferredoxin-NADP reductase
MLGKMALKPYLIYEITDLTKGEPDSPKITSFKLVSRDGQNFKFLPGMFSSIFINPEDKLFRSYSIASSPLSRHMEFMIEMINGKFTSRLSGLKVNDEIYISEPRGNFIYNPENVEKALFLAAGIGIAPFFSMLRYVRDIDMKKDITLLYSVKHKEDIVNPSELDGFTNIGLNAVFTVTRDPEDVKWKGETGRINIPMIKRHISDLNSRTVYLCGGIKFVKDIVSELVAEGIRNEDIKRDIWGE